MVKFPDHRDKHSTSTGRWCWVPVPLPRVGEAWHTRAGLRMVDDPVDARTERRALAPPATVLDLAS
jgi:hypothetical protein